MKNYVGGAPVVAGRDASNAGYPRITTSVPVGPEASGASLLDPALRVRVSEAVHGGRFVEGCSCVACVSVARLFVVSLRAPAERGIGEAEARPEPRGAARSAPMLPATSDAADLEWFELTARALGAAVKNSASARSQNSKLTAALAQAQEDAMQANAALEFARGEVARVDELERAGRIARAALDACASTLLDGKTHGSELVDVHEAIDVLNEALDTAPALSPADHAETPSSGEREPIQPEPASAEGCG